MKKSINEIRLELKAIADAHYQINDFAWKDFLRAYEENDLNYPLMCAYYPSGNILMNQTQIQLNIVICDRIEKDWNKNLNEVESDTLQICRDVFNILNESSRWQRIGRVSNCVVNKFVNRGGDEVAGHTMQIDFLIRDNSGVCDLPMVGYSFDQAINDGCPSVDIFNSDLSYTAEVASGGNLELPDITYAVNNSLGTTLAGATVPSVSNIETTLNDVDNIDSDGSTVPTPAGVAFTCTPPVDATAVLKDTAGDILSTTDIPSGETQDITAPNSTYEVEYINGTPIDSGFILSGGSKIIQVANPIICGDATAVLKDTLGTTISSTDIPSGTSDDITAPDATYTVQYENTTPIQSGSIVSGGSILIEVADPIICEDATLTLNTDAFLTVSSGSTTDISLVDQDDFNITPISVIGSVIKVDIPTGGGGGDTWVRNPDWLAMPTVNDTTRNFAGLYAVYENHVNELSIYCNNTTPAPIDWGDGTTSTLVNNVAQSHTYNYASITSSVLTNKRGNYKMVIVEIDSIDSTVLNVDWNGYQNGNWLDILIDLFGFTSFTFSYYRKAVDLERFITYNNSISSLPTFSLNSCNSLRILDFEPLNVSSLLGVFFSSTGNFTKSDNTPYDLVSTTATSCQQVFFSCSGLKNIGEINIPNSNSLALAFQNCYLLESVGNINIPLVTILQATFAQCQNLATIGTITTSSSLTNLQQAFFVCRILRNVNITNCTAVTNTTSLFSGCFSLESVILTGLTRGFDISGNNMSATALNAMFTAMGTASGSQTITVTGNPGAGTCNTTIATSKGYTVAI